MSLIDKTTNKYKNILKEKFDSKFFEIIENESDDINSLTNTVELYYNNELIIEIYIIFFFSIDEDDEMTDELIKEEYQLVINDPFDQYVSDDHTVIYDNETKFYWIVIDILNEIIKYKYYKNYELESKLGIENLLRSIPIIDIDEYNNFVNNIIDDNIELWKFVNKDVLTNEIKNKYNHLTLANNFDII